MYFPRWRGEHNRGFNPTALEDPCKRRIKPPLSRQSNLWPPVRSKNNTMKPQHSGQPFK